jgi:chromosome segregation ATPase
MIANLIRGMCRPDQDQTMALLTELVQTGLYTQELLIVVYKHMVSMAEVMNNQLITADNVRSLADNAVLESKVLRLQTQLDAANSELMELWNDDYVPRDVENEIRTKEHLSRALKEVDNLQRHKNAMEEDLYQSQTAKERLEQILKKQDTKLLDATNRALKAEGHVTRLQEELDRLVANAKKTVTQLETAQRAENVMGTQITNLRGKVQNLEGEAAHQECQIEDQKNEIGDLSNKLKEVQGHREYLQRQYTGPRLRAGLSGQQ